MNGKTVFYRDTVTLKQTKMKLNLSNIGLELSRFLKGIKDDKIITQRLEPELPKQFPHP
jgi:hypothetical protein